MRHTSSIEPNEILTPDAIRFVERLHRKFDPVRLDLLWKRAVLQRRLDQEPDFLPGFLPSRGKLWRQEWSIAPVPADLQDRRVEITGPVDRKMIINALNSGAQVFMADFEDSHSPTWKNTLEGQRNLWDAVRKKIQFTSEEGKHYALQDDVATLMVRPRGWHLEEKNFLVDGKPISASLFDFGLFFFHNAQELIARGTGPYFYLPKIENHLEARLWNDVFIEAQKELGIPQGTIKATVLIETILAAFEMDEILFELREHSAGLNCGRWDYIFSYIKKFRARGDRVLPDRAQVTMTTPFLKAYSHLLIQTCHRRGAHAMGGMAPQIPIKEDENANLLAMERVRADKLREVTAGHDGTWVAHPGLVALAKQIFDEHMPEPNQIRNKREDVQVEASDLLAVPEGVITEGGLRANVEVSVRYLRGWFEGVGCVPIHHLMEDAATVEISRAQLWQWVHHSKSGSKSGAETLALFRKTLKELFPGPSDPATRLLEQLVSAEKFEEFMTWPAGELLHGIEMKRRQCDELEDRWRHSPRWQGITRAHSAEDVVQLRGSLQIEHTLARRGAERLWQLLNSEEPVSALGALTGNQALQQVTAGLKAIYLSGWQVAADANLAGQMYPDQSLYPADSVPQVVRRINNAFLRADQIQTAEGRNDVDWFAPIIADAEAGFGGNLNAFELMKCLIEAGAAAVHFEDQLASAKKCGHMGGKVLVPTSEFIQKLTAARLAADTVGVPTLLIARTDAHSASLLTQDIDERDRRFCTGERTSEGFYRIRGGIDASIARGLAYAPFADLVWCETSEPNLEEAHRFAEAIHAQFPNKFLAYNLSPSFHWKKKLDDRTIALFKDELAKMGYRFQFITLAGFHSLNFSMFQLARDFMERGMSAYADFQALELAAESEGFKALTHQTFVGTGYFDEIASRIALGECSTRALNGSTEEDQFRPSRAG